jgi:hypothetical protein
MFNRFLSIPAWQKTVLAIGCVGLLVHLVVSVTRVGNKVGDYDINREFGRRFLAGEPLYQGGQCFNYMPSSALYWAPLALVPPRLGMALRYLTALVCLVATLHMLLRMMSGEEPGSKFEDRGSKKTSSFDPRSSIFNPQFSVLIMATLILGGHYLIRDLDDGGPNVILLIILIGGMYCFWRGRNWLGAFWLGLGIAVKITPGLFLAFLLWKRRWRLAAYAAAATILWILVPMVWMGPGSWWQHQQQWNSVALSVFDDADAGRAGNEQRVQNQALKPALMRYMVTYPAGHDLRPAHAGYVDFLNWPPEMASRVANGLLLALGIIFCWCTYRRAGLRQRPESPRYILGETAALLLLVLLFSPVTWLQHFVFALPAIFWIVTEQQRAPRKVTGAAIGLFAVLALLMNRELLGRQNYLLLLSYHTHTLCLLLLFGIVLARLSSRARVMKETTSLDVLTPKGQAA